jgi:hypothetical protein
MTNLIAKQTQKAINVLMAKYNCPMIGGEYDETVLDQAKMTKEDNDIYEILFLQRQLLNQQS